MDWIEATNTPKAKFDKDGMPKFYLCQIMIFDMSTGFKYSYRIGFITKEGYWNIEVANKFHKVTRYIPCECDKSDLDSDFKKYGKYFENALDSVIDNKKSVK